jgi:site-specific DNA-methyltransferase (cytosine-N4-specific)
MQSTYYQTELGGAYCGDALDILPSLPDRSVNLILTSPPFPLQKKKAYGNAKPADYVDWFLGFAVHFRRLLVHDGSLVVEFGAGWNKGEPTRSIYQYKVLVELCERFDFKLAQDLYWYNPAKLPTPAQWVTIERVRVKDAVTCVWWLARTAHPKANNRRVLVPYSKAMQRLFEHGYNKGKRPSGHNISDKFQRNNGGAIPPNLLRYSNTGSNNRYLAACREAGLPAHPARFPLNLPRFFIELLTDPGDLVLDPFAGSNLTGYTAETLGRRWISIEVMEEYLAGSKFWFPAETFNTGDLPSV